MRAPCCWLLVVLLAAGCGARSELESGADAAGSGGSHGAGGAPAGGGGTGGTAGAGGSPAPPPCLPPPSACTTQVNAEVFDLSGFDPPVIQDLGVAPGGPVLVGGYFGLARQPAPGAEFELVPAPPVLSSSFLQLQGGPGGAYWANAFEQTAVSFDAGGSWQPLGDPAIAKLFVLPGGELLVGGEASVGRLLAPGGPVSWSGLIEVLDGDTQGYFENNEVADVVRVGGQYLAAERFGRVAIAVDPLGTWSAAGQLGEDPELVVLDEQRVLALAGSGQLWIRCTPVADWQPLGQAHPLGAAIFDTTHAVRAPDGTLVAVADGGLQRSCDDGQSWQHLSTLFEQHTYGLALAGDTVWLAGFDHVYHLAW